MTELAQILAIAAVAIFIAVVIDPPLWVTAVIAVVAMPVAVLVVWPRQRARRDDR